MLTVAELASPPSVEENPRNCSRVIVDLELVELVSDVFSVVFHDVILKEGLVFGIQYSVFVVVWVIAVEWARKRCTLDDWPEEFENLLLQRLDAHILVADQDARHGDGSLRTEDHVTRPLLCDHELDWHELCRISAMHFTLKGHDLESALKPTNLEIIPRHHLNLLILDDADDRRCEIIECDIFSFFQSLVEDSLLDLLLYLTYSCPVSRGQRHSDLYARLDKAKWIVADCVGRVVRLTGNWDAQDIVGVESDRDMPADRAIHT